MSFQEIRMAFVLSLLMFAACKNKTMVSDLQSDSLEVGEVRGLKAVDGHLQERLFQGTKRYSWSLANYLGGRLSPYQNFLGGHQRSDMRRSYVGNEQNPFVLTIWWLTVNQFAEKMAAACDQNFSGKIDFQLDDLQNVGAPASPGEGFVDLSQGQFPADQEAPKSLIELNDVAKQRLQALCKDRSHKAFEDLFLLYVDSIENDSATKFAAEMSSRSFSSPEDRLQQTIVAMTFHPLFFLHRGAQ